MHKQYTYKGAQWWLVWVYNSTLFFMWHSERCLLTTGYKQKIIFTIITFTSSALNGQMIKK